VSRTDQIMLLFREIAIVDDLARRRLRDVLPHDLTEAQFGVLNHLRFTGNRHETPGDLARLFDVTRPAMTQLLGRMRSARLVELLPAAHDGRVRHVRLTALGRSRQAEVVEALAADLGRLGRHFSAAELEDLLGQLRRFRLLTEELVDSTRELRTS
jgi:DNA-binding MarR family transcriptional regulator